MLITISSLSRKPKQPHSGSVENTSVRESKTLLNVAQRMQQARLYTRVRNMIGICLERCALTMKKSAPKREHPTQIP